MQVAIGAVLGHGGANLLEEVGVDLRLGCLLGHYGHATMRQRITCVFSARATGAPRPKEVKRPHPPPCFGDAKGALS